MDLHVPLHLAAVNGTTGAVNKPVTEVMHAEDYDVYPSLTAVTGSNFCHIGVDYDKARGFAKVIAVTDNRATDTRRPVIMRLELPVSTRVAFDALAHAIEGYVAARATEESRGHARRTIVLIRDHLPLVAAGETGHGTREAMALAALLGGVNVACASTCLPHRLQQAMGAVRRIEGPTAEAWPCSTGPSPHGERPYAPAAVRSGEDADQHLQAEHEDHAQADCGEKPLSHAARRIELDEIPTDARDSQQSACPEDRAVVPFGQYGYAGQQKGRGRQLATSCEPSRIVPRMSHTQNPSCRGAVHGQHSQRLSVA
ncbi:iron-containing alcohol dehydrogenase [Streptomyces sp. SCA3-4]|uniref:iron-containing alcohol dehydrogenase n=1 Tax=Streptomyces sichuanensis TaxID=2871810 RepID=UPI001CE2D5CF|nr:iron-containing alcohol dehydrogenase [Streptomyces sichuanensis]MCA6091880.1 iron-containing alcohol dehydrogenase [Streptomyces sichuanensis]